MAWTEFTRPRYERSGGRYASDATDAEWALVAPLMPRVWTGRGQTGRGSGRGGVRRVGHPRTTDLRAVFDAILSIATTGCQWRMVPNDFPDTEGAPGFNGAALFPRRARERASGWVEPPPRGIGASGRRPHG